MLHPYTTNVTCKSVTFEWQTKETEESIWGAWIGEIENYEKFRAFIFVFSLVFNCFENRRWDCYWIHWGKSDLVGNHWSALTIAFICKMRWDIILDSRLNTPMTVNQLILNTQHRNYESKKTDSEGGESNARPAGSKKNVCRQSNHSAILSTLVLFAL